MKRVLIVDDAAFMRNALKFIIEKAGYEVVDTAAGGREAIEKFSRLKPDLVTMDILMPDLDGIEALKQLKAEWPEATVVMVTALGQEQKQEEARALGAAGYIRKPFSQEQIFEELGRVCGPEAKAA